MLWLVPGSGGFLLPLLLPHTFGVYVGRLCAVLPDRSVGELAAAGLETHRQGTRRRRP